MSQSQLNYVTFPSVSNANEDGLLAMGGDLNINTLVSAYQQGIFPWFNDDQPILWWSPDPRLVLFPTQIKISRSLRKTLRRQNYHVTCNQNFEHVIRGCALRGLDKPMHTEAETWITDSMHDAYLNLHQSGYAHSIEVWQNQQLVGGLYGLALGDVFFGESMFSNVTDASKIALVYLCRWLQQQSFRLIDCQVATEHLLSMGAQEIPRHQFLDYLRDLSIEKKSLNFSTGFSQFFSEPVI